MRIRGPPQRSWGSWHWGALRYRRVLHGLRILVSLTGACAHIVTFTACSCSSCPTALHRYLPTYTWSNDPSKEGQATNPNCRCDWCCLCGYPYWFDSHGKFLWAESQRRGAERSAVNRMQERSAQESSISSGLVTPFQTSTTWISPTWVKRCPAERSMTWSAASALKGASIMNSKCRARRQHHPHRMNMKRECAQRTHVPSWWSKAYV